MHFKLQSLVHNLGSSPSEIWDWPLHTKGQEKMEERGRPPQTGRQRVSWAGNADRRPAITSLNAAPLKWLLAQEGWAECTLQGQGWGLPSLSDPQVKRQHIFKKLCCMRTLSTCSSLPTGANWPPKLSLGVRVVIQGELVTR